MFVAFATMLVSPASALGDDWDLAPPQREPGYTNAPKYALLVFGHERDERVWMVIDGTTLYVDLNANGDLTDPNERLEAVGSNRFGGSGSHTHYDIFDFTIGAGATGSSRFKMHHWIRAKDFVPQTDFQKEVFSQRQELQYDNSTLWKQDGQGMGQTPLLFMPDVADAQVCALDGELTFVAKMPEHHILRRGSSSCDIAFHIAVMGRRPSGIDRQFYNPLTTDEVPEGAFLDITIDYPTADGLPLRRDYTLRRRC